METLGRMKTELQTMQSDSNWRRYWHHISSVVSNCCVEGTKPHVVHLTRV